jgi:hypothetical protein
MLKVSSRNAKQARTEKFIWQQLFVHTFMSVIIEEESDFFSVILQILSWSFGYVLQLDNETCDMDHVSGQPPLTSRLKSSIRNMKGFCAEDRVRRLLWPCFQTCKFGVHQEVMLSSVQTLCSHLPRTEMMNIQVIDSYCEKRGVNYDVARNNPFAECLFMMVSTST